MNEQHPIPQQISSYQFRLVGDMTLKQFFQVAGGALVSLLIYASELHPVVKWPLILFFALSGVVLAFLPFEDRPLSMWIIAFFRSVYSPTIYNWQKTKKGQKFFRDKAAPPPEHIVAPKGEKELKKYLKTRADQAGLFTKLEDAEKNFLAKITGLFGQTQQAPVQQPIQKMQKPQLQDVRSEQMKIPEAKPIKVVDQKVRQEAKKEERVIPAQPQTTQVTPTSAPQEKTAQAQAAQFSIDAAPPLPPTQPNTVSGQVMDPDGKIVEAAILEMQNVGGQPVRAVKTNKLGHFLIVTPLQDGVYKIITEKEGLEFEPVKFEATDSLIPPIAIRAKKRIKLSVEEKKDG